LNERATCNSSSSSLTFTSSVSSPEIGLHLFHPNARCTASGVLYFKDRCSLWSKAICEYLFGLQRPTEWAGGVRIPIHKLASERQLCCGFRESSHSRVIITASVRVSS
jgi:hypothetical protein